MSLTKGTPSRARVVTSESATKDRLVSDEVYLIRFSHSLLAGSGHHSEESAMCAMLLPNMPKFPLYELSCLMFFLVPMLSIAVLYVRMGLRIQNNGLGRSIEGAVHGETKQAQSRKAIIRMLSKFPFSPNHTHAYTRPCTRVNTRAYVFVHT